MMKIFAVTILTLIPIVTHSKVSNDECSTATVIPPNVALPYTTIISNFGNITVKTNNAVSSCSFDFDLSIWYKWEPSSTALVDFSYFGQSKDFNQVFPSIVVFEGSSCNDIEELACDRYLHLPAFEVIAGKKYFIAISASPSLNPNKVTFEITKTPEIPLNDECIDALIIPSKISFPYSTSPVLVTRATENSNDPVSKCAQDSPIDDTIETVWYTWIPSISGMYDLRTDKSTLVFGRTGLATAIEIYKGKSCDSVTEVACSPLDESIRGVKLDAGKKYFIKVITEFGDLGSSIILTVNPTPTIPPKNDDCINATKIDPLKGEIIRGDTFSATPDPLSDICGNYANPGLWYKFSPQKPMIIDVSTCSVGTTFDTRIAIFSGNTCNDLKCVASNDNGKAEDCLYSSKVSFFATELATYYILVDGFGFYSGNFEMTVTGNLNFFSLIDARTDKIIEELNDDDYFDYYRLPSPMLNIQTSFEEAVKSAFITFDKPRRSFCEKNAPFAVFGNNNSDFFGGSIPVGPHTVTATPFNQNNCKGPAGIKVSKSFEIGACEAYFQYYDFSVNAKVPKFFEWKPQITLIPACKVNIKLVANCGFDIGFVEFKIRNVATKKIVQTKKELDTPYFVFGNRGESINRGSLVPGNYTIEFNIDGVQHPNEYFTAFDNGSCK